MDLLQPDPNIQNNPIPAEPKKSRKIWFVYLAIAMAVLLAASAYGAYYYWHKSQPKACTQEAKQCSDGSYVGRTGPNCEFTACPSASPSPSVVADATAGWQTYENEKYGYLLKYPNKFQVVSQAMGGGIGDKDAPAIVIENPANSAVSAFNLQTRDSTGDPMKDIMKLGLKAYTTKIWQYNKDDLSGKEVGDLIETKVGNEIAYQFDLTASYKDSSGGYMLFCTGKEWVHEDFKKCKHLYVFLSNGKYMYDIHFPIDNQQSLQILSTFKFTQ